VELLHALMERKTGEAHKPVQYPQAWRRDDLLCLEPNEDSGHSNSQHCDHPKHEHPMCRYNFQISMFLCEHGTFLFRSRLNDYWRGADVCLLDGTPPRNVKNISSSINILMHEMEQAVANALEAETHLRKALEVQKDEPGLLNNLAVALSMQGKHTEAQEIADEIPVRFPDYFFGQVIAVRKAIQAGELEKAKPILDKMMQKQEMHVTEFGALCACQIDFMIEDDKPEGAISWFEMWQQGHPDDPALKNYEERMSIAELLTTFKRGLSKSRLKSKKRGNY
jgi:tetratricopeptide (TPR) repeat protein